MAEVPHRTSIDGNERNKSSSHAFLPPPVHPSSRPHVTGTTSSRLLNVSSRSRAEPPLHPLRAHAAPKLPSGITRNVSQFSPMPGSVEAFGEVLDFEDGSESVIDEEELSESQLRELYDEEEIDNFLHLFSAYVTEVRLPQNHKASPSNASLTDIVKEVETTDLDENMQASSDEEDSGWVSTQDSASAVESQPSQSTHPPSLPLANGPAELAANYLLRILPYPQPAPPPVTLSRLRLTAYRFYFAIVPAYVPLFSSLLKLATWQHEGTSLFYCAVYWISWYNNLILPGLILRLLYSLMWYKLMPHPTLQDLRQHRQEQHRADDFSRRVVVRLGSAPGFAVKDLLDVVKDFRSSRKTAATSKNEGKDEDTATAPDQTFDGSAVNDEVEVEHDAKLTQDEIEISRVALNAINQIIDLHERVKKYAHRFFHTSSR
ncbi:hypothetical protein EW026_g971 [Hermanssonia centrifuga]|uniref:Uncharacterized protein n=1 Tax=Hermanssonia centrifuga TaxID=98765 RepID=A0A4S4KXM7_9APHY|nr:hypothetical protein EW026_g971 [Hermanssonia centrifuga]